MIAASALLVALLPALTPVRWAGSSSTTPLLHTRALSLRGGDVALQLNALSSLGALYSSAIVAKPIITKSITSAVTLALSDAAAQSISPPAAGRDTKRTVITALIGLLYFGPALHYYLNFVTWLVPGDGLLATLLKTLIGQLGFGPAITSIFFAAFLVSDFGIARGLAKWPAKLRQDLFVTWASELCFWPFVDLICFSIVPLQWIPLGYNFANFFWTIFLALQASRPVQEARA